VLPRRFPARKLMRYVHSLANYIQVYLLANTSAHELRCPSVHAL
jgi:hypothetical protein